MINLGDPQWIIALTGVFGYFIGLTIWSVRLEGKAKQNNIDVERLEKNLDSLEKKSDSMNEKVFEKLSNIEITLANLLGKLDNNSNKKL